MTETNPSLTEFLLARFAQDEAAARAASGGTWLVDTDADDFPVLAPDAPDFTWDGVFVCSTRLDEKATASREDAEHIARHDPARVLADVEAKRRIVEEYLAQEADIEKRHDPDYNDDPWDVGYAGGLGRALELLAQPYAAHPEFRGEWAL